MDVIDNKQTPKQEPQDIFKGLVQQTHFFGKNIIKTFVTRASEGSASSFAQY
jgi:hypothetical protein